MKDGASNTELQGSCIGDVTRRKRIILLLLVMVLTVPIVLTGCQSKEDRKEVIEQLAEAQKDKKEASKSLSDKIVDNMKENSAKQYEQIFEVQEAEEKKMNDSLGNDLSFEEETERVTDKVGGFGWRFFFRLIFAMSDNALPGSFVCVVIGLILAFFTRNNKIAYKFYLAVAVVGPLLFILSIYLPAAMVQFYIK